MRWRTVAGIAVVSLLASLAFTQPLPFRAAAQTFEPDPTCSGGGASITTGPDGKIWFGERSDHEVGRLTLPSGPIDEAYALLPPEGDMAGGSDGNIWTVSGGVASVIKPDLSIENFELPSAGGDLQTGGTVAGSDGNIWNYRKQGSAAELLRIAPNHSVTVIQPAIPPISLAGKIVAGPDSAMWFFAKLSSEPTRWRLFRATYDLSDVHEIVANPNDVSVFGPVVVGTDVWYIRNLLGASQELVHVDVNGIAGTATMPVIGYAIKPAAGPDGRIWFGNSQTSGIIAVALDGTTVEYPGSGSLFSDRVQAITAGADGKMWFTTDSHVGSIAVDGTLGVSFEIPLSRGPVVTCSVTPDHGSTNGGQVLTIRGRGFSRATQVLFADVSLPFTLVSDFEIRTTTHASPSGDFSISVRSPQAPQNWSSVSYRAIGPAVASSACPGDGPIGGGYWITVTGKDMDLATAVRFGDRGVSHQVQPAYGPDAHGELYVLRDAIRVKVPAGRGGGVRMYAGGPYGDGPQGGLFVYTRLPVSADPCVLIGQLRDDIAGLLPNPG